MVRLLRSRMRQGVGKIRRAVLSRVGQTYIEEWHGRRQGECIRCGTCCKLLFQCPFLIENDDGTTMCRIHNKRPRNCRVFPINRKDILDRNSVRSDLPCGYYFDE